MQLGNLFGLLDVLPPLRYNVNPLLAFFVGIVSGFPGLGLLFLSLTDFIIPTVLLGLMVLIGALTVPPIAILLTVGLASPLLPFYVAFCMLFQGFYGFLRAANSNQRRGAWG